jgi:hypothetical protein
MTTFTWAAHHCLIVRPGTGGDRGKHELGRCNGCLRLTLLDAATPDRIASVQQTIRGSMGTRLTAATRRTVSRSHTNGALDGQR